MYCLSKSLSKSSKYPNPRAFAILSSDVREISPVDSNLLIEP